MTFSYLNITLLKTKFHELKEIIEEIENRLVVSIGTIYYESFAKTISLGGIG